MMAAQKLYEAGHITYMRTDNPLLSQEAATAIRTYVQTTYGEPYLGPPGQNTIQPTTATPTPAKKTKAKPDTAPQPPEAQAAGGRTSCTRS